MDEGGSNLHNEALAFSLLNFASAYRMVTLRNDIDVKDCRSSN